MTVPPKTPLTETRNPRTMFIDRLPTRDIVKTFIEEDQAVFSAVAAPQKEITRAVDLIVRSFQNGGRLIYLGAGTSGRLGVLDASECPPTFGVSPAKVVAVIAGGDHAVRHAAEGAEDNREQAVTDLEKINLVERDTLVGITASGRTPYVSAGLAYGKKQGCATVLLACDPYGPFPEVDVLINPVVGPEVITGSTRLKSGTACKMVLNMLSSIAMIRTGNISQNLIVDVRATNDKLRRRAQRIVMEGGNVPNYMADAFLVDAEGEAKVAIYLARKGGTPQEAREKLHEAGGHLFRALDEQDYTS